jgi:hypothetical protein
MRPETTPNVSPGVGGSSWLTLSLGDAGDVDGDCSTACHLFFTRFMRAMAADRVQADDWVVSLEFLNRVSNNGPKVEGDFDLVSRSTVAA